MSFLSKSGFALNGWQVSGSAFWWSGLPFSVVSAAYSANGNGIVNGSGPQFARVVPGVPLYEHNSIAGVTEPGTIQWLNPNAFLPASIRARANVLAEIPLGYAGIPGLPSTQTGFGALTYTTSPHGTPGSGTGAAIVRRG